jgi:hypothetical protein
MTVHLGASEALQAETLYGDEIEVFRRRGARLCEFTRLALDAEECGREALACLFHLGFIFAYRIHRATDLFIEVNPRHALFYRRKLGFTRVGEEKVCPRVNAPAILLHKPLATFADELGRLGGVRTPDNKSFYAMCLPHEEENELVRAIEAMLAETRAAATSSADAGAAIEDLARSA